MTRERDSHQSTRAAIAAHFAGAGTPRRDQAMRAHLPECADCRALYDDHLLVAGLDPGAPSAASRLARGLGLPVQRSPARAWFPGLTALAGVAAAAVILVTISAPRLSGQLHDGKNDRKNDDTSGAKNKAKSGASSESGAFVARGAGDGPGPEFLVYRIGRGGGAPEPAGGALHPGDEVAFAYRNPTGKLRLMVFAVDEHGHVYWYHPGWSNPADNPTAVAISPAPGLHELPAAVAQRYDGTRLEIHALFTDQDITVRQVEAALGASAANGLGRASEPGSGKEGREWPFSETTDVTRAVQVAP